MGTRGIYPIRLSQLYPSNPNYKNRLHRYWWWWLFVVPSLRSRRPKGAEKKALDIAFLATPAISLVAPVATKDTGLIWAANFVVVAASYTAETFDTGTLQILRAVTGMTWPVFFDEVLTAADGFYAVLAAGLAAFLANRRLTRSQYYALRLWRGQSDGHE